MLRRPIARVAGLTLVCALLYPLGELQAAQRGGGRGGGGGGARGGRGGGAAMGGNRGGMGGGAAMGGNRGGMGGGAAMGGNRGGMGGGGGMGHSPSFSTPRGAGNGGGNFSAMQNRQPAGANPGAHAGGGQNPFAGGRGNTGANPGARATGGQAGAGARTPIQAGNGQALAGNRNPGAPGVGAANAGQGLANRNQTLPNNGAGALAANRNNTLPNNGAGAAGAAAANRNNTLPNNGAGAAGAAIANRNNSLPNNGAGLAGAAVANNRQEINNRQAAMAGAAYGNRNAYNNYYPGVVNGYWNNHSYPSGWGLAGAGAAVGAWAMGSSAYGWGYSNYTNPYQAAVVSTPAQPAYNYAQPINTAAAPPDSAAADPAVAAFDQARAAFQGGDYPAALTLSQQALQAMPNDSTLHEFLALVYFAQGQYDQAAAPLYAVLSTGPGWNWTTLIGMYADADVYTRQLRALEAFAKGNPASASGQLLLAYHYLTQGHADAAAKALKNLTVLMPTDPLAKQLLAQLEPAANPAPAAAPAANPPADPARLVGQWSAQAPSNASITLILGADGAFSWSASAPGQTPFKISGTSSLDAGVLSLNAADAQAGAMAGSIDWKDDQHFVFRPVGAPPTDAGLAFTRQATP